MKLPYDVVDVFTKTALEGNALAVFPDASGLDGFTMQRIARELNLSETTFVVPAESTQDGTRVRIFTPAYEMQFAGHPTIGTAYVLRRRGMVPAGAQSFVLLENVGPVRVRVDAGDDPKLWLTTPPIATLGSYPREQCARALSLDEGDLLDVPCELRSAGNPNLYVAVRDAATVDRAALDVSFYLEMIADREDATCMYVFAPVPGGAYSRMFAPQLGVSEDPATGSAAGPLVAFMMAHGLAPSHDGAMIVNEQGTKMGRRSLLYALVHGDAGSRGIEIGGDVTPVATGTFEIPIGQVLAGA